MLLITISIISGCGIFNTNTDLAAKTLTPTQLDEKLDEVSFLSSIISNSFIYYQEQIFSNNLDRTNKHLSNKNHNLLSDETTPKVNWSTEADQEGWYQGTYMGGNQEYTLKLRYFPTSNKLELQELLEDTSMFISIVKDKNQLLNGYYIIAESSIDESKTFPPFIPSDISSITGKTTFSSFNQTTGCGVFDIYVTANSNSLGNLENEQRFHLGITMDSNSTENYRNLNGWFKIANERISINNNIPAMPSQEEIHV